VDQQKKILARIPDKDVESVYKALKTYVDKYEEVLKATLVDL